MSTRIALLSDIHANLSSLKAVLGDIDRGFEGYMGPIGIVGANAGAGQGQLANLRGASRQYRDRRLGDGRGAAGVNGVHRDPATVSSCCAPTEQKMCCDSSEKADCRGSSTDGSCSCQ